MSLRPRYSLLTLLVLTALVAGGAAFWLRPKQVIEKLGPNSELETTYVRNWRGEWIIDGPRVLRHYQHGDMIDFSITWFRKGVVEFGWDYYCWTVTEENARLYPYTSPPELPGLSPEERHLLQRAIDQEKTRFKPGAILQEGEFFRIPVVGFLKTEFRETPLLIV